MYKTAAAHVIKVFLNKQVDVFFKGPGWVQVKVQILLP